MKEASQSLQFKLNAIATVAISLVNTVFITHSVLTSAIFVVVYAIKASHLGWHVFV